MSTRSEGKFVPQVELIEGKGGQGKHLRYWHIFSEGKRAGKVYIDLADDEILGKHNAIQIFLNKASQGKGIGRLGYKIACETSGFSEIYAHMRKSNIASKKAALAAGFVEVKNEKLIQLVLVWKI